MEEIKIKILKRGEELEPVSIDYLYNIVDSNRNRVRVLAGLLLTTCSILLSTSFVILFFILQTSTFKIPKIIPILLFLTVGSLILSIVCNIFSVLLPSPTAARNKAELIDTLARVYYREYKRVRVAIIFLIIAILLFTTGLAILAFISL
jgi:hypothetical protein